GETHLLRQGTLAPAATSTTSFTVSTGDPLKVTLVWTDPEATADGAGVNVGTRRLINDLDLQVIGPGGTFMPWTLNPAQPGNAALRNARNSIDTVEQVLIDTPLGGTYTIRVSHTGGLAGN